jgi:hypothetical protein
MTMKRSLNVMPIVMAGPNGLVEIRQFNAVQGWHSGYMTPEDAVRFAEAVRETAESLKVAAPEWGWVA